VKAAFAAVPFQQWVAEGAKTELPWHPRITPPKLTPHERIALQLEVQLDGIELVAGFCIDPGSPKTQRVRAAK
jgi:hypothetical protein